MEKYQSQLVLKLNGKITTIIILNNKKDIAICSTNGYLYI